MKREVAHGDTSAGPEARRFCARRGSRPHAGDHVRTVRRGGVLVHVRLERSGGPHRPQVRRPRRCDGPPAPPPLPHPRPRQPDARANPVRPGGDDLRTSRAAPPRSTPSATTSATSSTRRLATIRPARWSCWRPTATPTPRWAAAPSCCGSRRAAAQGVLTDGRLRDFDELARYDFAAYCSGEATRWGGDQRHAVSSERAGGPRRRWR